MDYRGEFVYRDSKGHLTTVTWSGLHPNSDDALHAMHRYAQCEHDPKLKRGEYRVKRLYIVFKEEFVRKPNVPKVFEQNIEVPAGENPDVTKSKVKPEPHPDFPFVNADLLSQSQKAREASSA